MRVHIKAINLYKWIRNKAYLLKWWMDVRKWDWKNKTLHIGYYSDSKSNIGDQVVKNIYAIIVGGLLITFTFPTCRLKDCPEYPRRFSAICLQTSGLDGGWVWTVRCVNVEPLLDIWRGEVERKEIRHELQGTQHSTLRNTRGTWKWSYRFRVDWLSATRGSMLTGSDECVIVLLQWSED